MSNEAKQSEAEPKVSTEGEQITREPSVPSVKATKGKKEKDPKKVAAGRKLAEYNKKAKEALERERKREEEAEGTSGAGWLPDTRGAGITLGAIVIGLTSLAAFKLLSHKNKFTFGTRSVSNPPTPTNVGSTTPSEEKRPSKIPIPTRSVGLKVGME